VKQVLFSFHLSFTQARPVEEDDELRTDELLLEEIEELRLEETELLMEDDELMDELTEERMLLEELEEFEEHEGFVTVFACIVTPPFRARTRPSTVAFVLSVTEERATIVPLKTELEPTVAELPTFQ